MNCFEVPRRHFFQVFATSAYPLYAEDVTLGSKITLANIMMQIAIFNDIQNLSSEFARTAALLCYLDTHIQYHTPYVTFHIHNLPLPILWFELWQRYVFFFHVVWYYIIKIFLPLTLHDFYDKLDYQSHTHFVSQWGFLWAAYEFSCSFIQQPCWGTKMGVA